MERRGGGSAGGEGTGRLGAPEAKGKHHKLRRFRDRVVESVERPSILSTLYYLDFRRVGFASISYYVRVCCCRLCLSDSFSLRISLPSKLFFF